MVHNLKLIKINVYVDNTCLFPLKICIICCNKSSHISLHITDIEKHDKMEFIIILLFISCLSQAFHQSRVLHPFFKDSVSSEIVIQTTVAHELNVEAALKAA